MASSTHLPDGSALCLSCGMCCRGVLHGHALLEATERTTARALGFDVIDTDDGSAFRLPCPQLSGNACQIYEQRPRTCAGYRCGMLDEFLAGRLSLGDGRSRVAELARLVAEVRAVTDPALTMPQIRALWRRGLDGYVAAYPDETARAQLAYLRITALCSFLDRHVLAGGERRLTDDAQGRLEQPGDPA